MPKDCILRQLRTFQHPVSFQDDSSKVKNFKQSQIFENAISVAFKSISKLIAQTHLCISHGKKLY